ncbi:MAG: response regulator [Armatimonadota bacterium]
MSGRRVLIADERKSFCRVLEAELAHAGCTVTCVHDGTEAVEAVKRRNYDLVLLDSGMPVRDSASILDEIRTINRDARVVLMSACEPWAADYGVECIKKPFDIDRLLAFMDDPFRDPLDNSQTISFARGRRILIETSGDGAGRYESAVEKADTYSLTLRWPMVGGRCISLMEGDSISVGLPGDDAYYYFEAELIACREQRGEIAIGRPSTIFRVQRRRYQRAQARIPVAVFLKGEMHRLVTEDVGAGGVRIITPVSFPEGARVVVHNSVANEGLIVRKRSLQSGWDYGIAFSKASSELVHTA